MVSLVSSRHTVSAETGTEMVWLARTGALDRKASSTASSEGIPVTYGIG
ncbi:Uncharacterised protein [Mycobacteroides abscessus subsp. abscessus]|nr:Uncharacterised protein [Mycobacteroides abscessus subsp. abscessus]